VPSKPTTIPSKSLRAYLDANKRQTRLVGPLERHLLARPFDDRRMDILHPSDIIKGEFCARAAYHALRGDYEETRDKPGLRLQSIFDEGHAIHDKWQKWVWEMGSLYGRWLCRLCDHTWWDTSPSACAGCGESGFLKYKEVPLTDDKHMIAGHADGWVTGLGDDYLIEIKSIGIGTIRMEAPSLLSGADGDLEAAWRGIRQPFRSHLLQGQVYLHLCHLMEEAGLLERPAPNEIVFLYELKANQDYKEFSVMYDPGYVESNFDIALDIAFAVANSLEPACSVDPVKGCKRCAPYRGGIDES
jgi:hypothetical protein